MTQLKRCRREKLNKTELTCREPQRCPEVQLVLLLEKYGLNYMPSAASDEQTPRPARLQGMPLMLTIWLKFNVYLILATSELSFCEVNQSVFFFVFLVLVFYFSSLFHIWKISEPLFHELIKILAFILINVMVFCSKMPWNNSSSGFKAIGVGWYSPCRVGTAQ